MRVIEHSPGILQKFSGGDLDAFETLFNQHQGEVYGWIVRIIRDRTTAEDLTIETFWRIHHVCASFDPSRNFGAWLRRIATNVAIDHLRKVRPETELLEGMPSPPLPNPAISEELRVKTVRAFRKLPPKLQVTATLALIEEQPYKEIAAALDISISAVKLRVFRSVRLLRKELKRQGVEP